MAVNVTVQETPNPQARRFVVDRPVQDESRGRFFTDPGSADDPLAARLLAAEGVTAVLLLPTSVTVTKEPGAAWDDVEPVAQQALEGHFS